MDKGKVYSTAYNGCRIELTYHLEKSFFGSDWTRVGKNYHDELSVNISNPNAVSKVRNKVASHFRNMTLPIESFSAYDRRINPPKRKHHKKQ